MNCPFCKTKLFYDSNPSGVYYRIRCPNSACRCEELQENLFFAFGDDYPKKEITDYSLLLKIDNAYYTFLSVRDGTYTSIEVMVRLVENDRFWDGRLLYSWNEFIPFQEDLEPYITRVKRLINLKAFW